MNPLNPKRGTLNSHKYCQIPTLIEACIDLQLHLSWLCGLKTVQNNNIKLNASTHKLMIENWGLMHLKY